MLDGVQGAGRTGDLAAGGLEQQRSLGDRINDALSWALPDGIILHALQPVLADGLRHLGVKLPDWATSAEAAGTKLQAAGSAIGQYLAGVAHNPAKVGDDIKGWIGANWNSLKADHAKAAAPGPDAEAKWWGQVAGRATFEIAAVVVPATNSPPSPRRAKRSNSHRAPASSANCGEPRSRPARSPKSWLKRARPVA